MNSKYNYYIVLLVTAMALCLSGCRLYQGMPPMLSAAVFSVSFILNFSIIFLLLFIPGFRYIAFGCFSGFVISYNLIESLYGYYPPVLISAALDTNWSELSGWLHWSYYIFIPLFVFLVFLYIKLMKSLEPKFMQRVFDGFRAKGKRVYYTFLAMCVLLLATLFCAGKYAYHYMFPFPGMLNNYPAMKIAAWYPLSIAYDSLVKLKEAYEGDASLITGLTDPEWFDSEMSDTNDEMIFVFIIGETSMASHASLNGYARQTTPFLDAERDREFLVSFPDTLSYGSWTDQSVIGMFTNSNMDGTVPQTGNFAGFFRKHGFETVYVSCYAETRNLLLLMKGMEIRRKNSSGEVYEEIANNSSRKKMFIAYTKGNHFPFKERYPAEFARFLPDNHSYIPNNNSYEILANAYDNSMLFVDYELGNLLHRLKDKRAVVFYAGDHGELLGEEGMYGRNNDPDKNGRKPLMFVWVSERYKETNPQVIDNLKSWRKEKINHANIFHTMLGLGGISFSLYEEDKDLSRKRNK